MPMRFVMAWLVQSMSVVGSHTTGFALGIMLYEQTGSPAVYGGLLFATVAPAIVASPLAGAYVDRFGVRAALRMCHGGAGAATLVMLGLHLTGNLDLVGMLICLGFGSLANALHIPSFCALAVRWVPPEAVGRATGLIELTSASVYVVAPATAAALIAAADLSTVLAIDICTFVLALIVFGRTVARPRPDAAATGHGGPLAARLMAGFRFIWSRRAFRRWVLFEAFIFLALGTAQALVTPLVLTIASPATLGLVLSVGGGGMVLGALAVVRWPAGDRAIATVAMGGVLLGGFMLLPATGVTIPTLMIAAVGVMFAIPIVLATLQAHWLTLTPVGQIGRSIASRSALCAPAEPIGMLLAGALSERVVGPALATSPIAEWALGPTPAPNAAGAVALFAAVGLLTLIASIGLALSRRAATP